ncbi:MAG: GntR family transcriptional regulator [Desulfovibrionaceae bacterium]|nr:GntR family transcriptional regulator [Desulfovibrionaceae bacterium]
MTESITRRLRGEIITGKLAAGAKLNEADLAERYGVSRPPLREAFRRLENEALIVSTPRKGVCVAETSVEDCEQVYRARLMLECTAVDLLKEQGNRALELSDCMHEQFELMEHCDNGMIQNSIEECFFILAAIHSEIIKISKNIWMLHHYRTLQSVMARYQILYLNIPGSIGVSVADHAKICSLLNAGKYDEAKERLTVHVESTKERTLCAMTTK